MHKVVFNDSEIPPEIIMDLGLADSYIFYTILDLWYLTTTTSPMGDTWARISYREIALAAGTVCTRTVIRVVCRLKKKKYIKVKSPRRGDPDRSLSYYPEVMPSTFINRWA